MLQASLALRINALAKQSPDTFNKVITRVKGTLGSEGMHRDLMIQALEQRLLSSDEAKFALDPNKLREQ